MTSRISHRRDVYFIFLYFCSVSCHLISSPPFPCLLVLVLVLFFVPVCFFLCFSIMLGVSILFGYVDGREGVVFVYCGYLNRRRKNKRKRKKCVSLISQKVVAKPTEEKKASLVVNIVIFVYDGDTRCRGDLGVAFFLSA